MPTREQQRAAAIAHDTRRAVAAIIRRGGDPDLIAGEIHQAYAGRYEMREKAAASARCTEHPGIAPPCPICI